MDGSASSVREGRGRLGYGGERAISPPPTLNERISRRKNYNQHSWTAEEAEGDNEDNGLLLAVTFLEDALGYRDPDYKSDPGSIRSYRLRQSRAWRTCTVVAVLAYIAACFLGKPPFSADWRGMPEPSATQKELGQTWGLCLECGCVLFFSFDIYLLYRCTSLRSILTCWWKAAFVMSLFLSVADVTTRWYTHRPWSRAFRPAVFFFVGPKVRDCSLSTLHAVGALVPVLVLELLVTLAYACVCVVLYHGVSDAPFTSLGDAFLNLFALSTTVNDPDVWMSLYHRNRANVLVFCSFLVVQVFLLHNILLASVWNEFGERMKVFAKKKRRWREESVRRAFASLDLSGSGHLPRDTVMTLLGKIRPHYDGSKRYMMYERIVQSVNKSSRSGKMYEADEVTQVNRREFCNNVVEALSLQIRTMRERKIARTGQYLLLPLYVWNMVFVVGSCAMSPWVFNMSVFWLALIPTSVFLGASVLAELIMTGVRAYMVLPWNRVKTVSLVLTVAGLFWFLVFTTHNQWGSLFWSKAGGKIRRGMHMQVSIGLLMSARCIDLGTLLKLVPAIHDVVSIMYMITPSVFAQAGVIFTIFHVYAYLGMALYGGVVTPGADFGDTPFANSPYYYDNNFNSYPEGLVTLFELLVVNNWNILISGYIHASSLGMWAYLYFLSFITLAVALALNVLTAIFMTAFTAKTTKANMPAVRGAGAISQRRGMSSYSARTALGAGASLEIRPTRPSDGEQDSDAGGGTSTADVSHGPRKGSGSEDNKVVWGKEDDGSGSVKRNRNAGPARRSSTGSSGVSGAAGEYQDSGSGAAGSSVLRSPVSGRGPASGSSLGSGSASASASAFTSASQQFQPDPLLSRLSATAVLPEDEEVVHKAGGGESTDLRDMRQDSYLGWGSGGAEMPPPAPGAGVPSRGRWGSGHYYKVSRRNSYSDKEMFEAGLPEQDEEDQGDIAGKVLGAIAVGLGNTVGIRACVLRYREEAQALNQKTGISNADSPRGRREPDYGGEEELEQPESYIMFENLGFREMVAPHLPGQRRGVSVPFGAIVLEKEGWEVTAMRDEMTDAMLHTAFGEAIYSECPPPLLSPDLGASRSSFTKTPASSGGSKASAATTAAAATTSSMPPSPTHTTRSRRSMEPIEQEDEDDEEIADFDLPKDLGLRTWSKTLSKEERANRTGYKSKTAVLSIQCVLASRTPTPVVVYTARIQQ